MKWLKKNKWLAIGLLAVVLFYGNLFTYGRIEGKQELLTKQVAELVKENTVSRLEFKIDSLARLDNLYVFANIDVLYEAALIAIKKDKVDMSADFEKRGDILMKCYIEGLLEGQKNNSNNKWRM